MRIWREYWLSEESQTGKLCFLCFFSCCCELSL